MNDKIKIESGGKRKFTTGAEKQAASGKGTPVLVPGDAILEVAKHFEGGIPIYGARNWEKGIPLSEILNSLERHLHQEKMGLTDEPHARALVWNALVYLATKLRIKKGLLPSELADMPVYEDDYNAVEIDGPVFKEFKVGDTVEIKLDPEYEFGDSIQDAVINAGARGTYVGKSRSGTHGILLARALNATKRIKLFFFNDEVFPVEDKMLNPNPSRAINLTGE